jgi:hypothetical protein
LALQASSDRRRGWQLHPTIVNSDCLRTGTFFCKNPCPEEANTSARISIYSSTPI